MGWVKPSALLLALYGAYVSSSVNSYQLPKSPSASSVIPGLRDQRAGGVEGTALRKDPLTQPWWRQDDPVDVAKREAWFKESSC